MWSERVGGGVIDEGIGETRVELCVRGEGGRAAVANVI